MADKHIAVSGCVNCPAETAGLRCALSEGVRTTSHPYKPAPADCPLRQGRVILFLNEKREG